MKGASLFCLPLLSVGVLCSFLLFVDAQILAEFNPSSGSPVSAQVDGEGRVYVAAGRQLLSFNRNLVLQQNVSLPSDVVRISLGSGGERLVVCTLNGSCAVYSTSDLSANPSLNRSSALPGGLAANATLFTSGNTFYVGSHDQTPPGIPTVNGIIRLAQYDGLQGSSNFMRSMNYNVFAPTFQRVFIGGFVSGGNAYYVASDVEGDALGVKVMRVCDNGCNGSATCSFNALYEETIRCGRPFGGFDSVCGLSLVEDFAGTEGPSIVLSRCRPSRTDSNLVCLFPLMDIDAAMEMRFNDCMNNRISSARTELIWSIRGFCNDLDLPSMCEIFDGSTPVALGNSGDNPITSQAVINIGADQTASVAVQLEEFSLVVVAYTNTNGNFIAIFRLTDANTVLSLSNGFEEKPVPSAVRSLQWEAGLDFVIATTDTQLLKVPIEECSSNTDCSSCVADGNPLCGWCVVENKCSRQAQCQNGNSSVSVRWIPSSDPAPQCIINTITPDLYLLDDQQVLNVTVGGPGLPAKLENETYSCRFEDSMRRFTITVPAVEVTPGTAYTCDIRNEDIAYDGVQSVVNFSFVSSLVGIPFDTTSNALTIFQCNAADSCSECLEDGSVCGWCQVNKICRGTDEDCRDPGNFLQLGDLETFDDVCPLLNGTVSYLQHVRVNTNLQLTTMNLPETVDGFNYMCRIGRATFSATRNSLTSLTCEINSNELMLSASAGTSEVADVSIVWMGEGVNHQIDNIGSPTVTVYDCSAVSGDCSACVSTIIVSGFQCGWCSSTSPASCRVQEECAQSPLITDGLQCPNHMITRFSPSSGPPSGGTVITIEGMNLGTVFQDFDSLDSIIVGGESCTPLSESYISGARVLCRTNANLTTGAVTITLQRSRGLEPVTAEDDFIVTMPRVSSVFPTIGPIAGGSSLRVEGTGLDVGNSARVFLNGTTGPECLMIERSATVINCTTPRVNSTVSEGQLVLRIDEEVVTNNEVLFSYLPNPNFTSVRPSFSITSGGVRLTFTGTNLNVARNPQLVLQNGNRFPCVVVNSTTLNCTAPPGPENLRLSYRLELDDAPFPDMLEPGLQLMVRPDPTGFSLLTQSVVSGSDSLFVQIQGFNFDSVLEEEIKVFVGGLPCAITSVEATEVVCNAPSDPMLDSENRAAVNISVGENLSAELSPLEYKSSPDLPILTIVLAIVIPVVAIFFSCIIVIMVIICLSRRFSKKKEKQYSNLIAKMELLEYEMADECKRAFTELQTDLADLVQISSDKNLPYRDFRTFAMRFLFPKASDDHPVLLPLQVTGVKLEEEAVMKQLDIFKDLIMDKKFLLVFVHTLESQPTFSLQDKCNVASLLMVAFQNDLDYATDVLQTLLAEMMRKTIAKSHPKLLLRRTESVAEKMLANWQAFLLFPYLLEHVGEPLFILYRAIKSQLEKGPVDVVSGEAKNSLSEEKLLRQHMEVKPVEGMVIHEDEEELGIKMWDCDSITQAKEKILDTLYRNTPVSKRPQLTKIDLELIGKGANGVTLRDQDATNHKDGEWIKINTLGHYKLDEMSKNHTDNPRLPVPKFRLIARLERPLSGVSNFDTLGTIISNISAANRNSMAMSASELSHVYHLVKPEPEDGEGGGQKIMSEVFLTRLLSTKRILQPYVDKLFEAIFAVPHGKSLPKAIKCLFDFLDLQAADLGITDSDILHSWKTNSVPLRFWVNVIKNPDFVFDINKSATVDSCLTVIAQAYIDATSTADIKYTKDTPSARLLYVNEVKKYKAGVESYYSTIQSLPKLSNSDMAEYLRDTAQVCANSVKQYDPTVVNDPALMTRKLYFVTESALFELYKFASAYSDDIIDALNEEGLTIPAAQFDQLRKKLS